jgi:hypothetical protein
MSTQGFQRCENCGYVSSLITCSYCEANVLVRDNQARSISLLKSLLREWRDTEFFESREAWRKWVDNFGLRVDEALDGK